MNIIAMILFGLLLVGVLLQVGVTWLYTSVLASQGAKPNAAKPLGKAAIVLCLRGADPFLPDCIRALLRQDYPDYAVHIIIDHETDPAWTIVQQTLATEPSQVPVHVATLQSPHASCSLKCSALLQAIEQIAADVEVVALIDADTIAPTHWLRELVNPLSDSTVGLTTGGRWYLPTGQRWGSVLRYLWNMSAIVSMYINQTPWGGTLAVRADLLRQSDLYQRWSQTLCEDVPLRQLVLDRGLKIQFVPSLLIVNQEACDLPSFVRWSSRQLLLTRLYHPSWTSMAIVGILFPLLPILTAVLLVIAALSQDDTAVQWLGAGLLLNFGLGSILPAIWLDRAIRRVATRWSTPIAPFSLPTQLQLLLALPLSYFTSVMALITAMRADHLEWRGITYQIHSADRVHLIKYYPYQINMENLDSNLSI